MITVLLVEDDVRLADALAGALEPHGYAVTQVRTAEQALAADPADVVLLDLGLPDMDGVEVTRRIREWSPAPTTTSPSPSPWTS